MSSNRLIKAGHEARAATFAFLAGAILSALVVAEPAIAADHSDDHLSSVSMVALLVSPEKYVGKRVDVTGYLTRFFLFLAEESAFRADTASAFPLSPNAEAGEALNDCDMNHVLLTARLVKDLEFEAYSLAELESIVVYDIVDGSSKTCWRREDPNPEAAE